MEEEVDRAIEEIVAISSMVGRSPKREELLRNGFREEIGLPMTDTKHREWL